MTDQTAPGAEQHDVIVVGGGFAGSLVAKALGDKGWRVLVLEAGIGSADAGQGQQDAVRRFHDAFPKMPNSPYRTTDAAPSPDHRDLFAPQTADGPGGYLVQQGNLPFASTYLRANGGTGLIWTGLTPRMHPEDFRSADLGPGRNWPVDYAALEPYYRAAERELGVAADVDEQRVGTGLPFPDGYVFPMHAIPRSHLDEVIAAGVDGHRIRDPYQPDPAELLVVGTPHARNGVPNARYVDDRAGTATGFTPIGRRCTGFASCLPICPEEAKYTPLRTQSQWSGTVTLRTQSVVGRVRFDSSGVATGVEYRRYDTESDATTAHTATADVVVVAAHAIQNAVLLLASGITDHSDQLGRNLMDHPVLLTWGLLPEPVGPYRGPGSTSGIEAFRFGPARAHRAPFRMEIGNWGWVWADGPPAMELDRLLRSGNPLVPNGRGLFGRELRRTVGDRVGRQFTLQFEVEQVADPANRVTIDPARLDRLGNPRPIVHYDLGAHVRRGFVAAKAISDQIFDLLGAEDHTEYRPGHPGYFEYDGTGYTFWGAGHAAGTHVMGDSAAESVVDADQRCWHHPNLFAVGCGSMPSLGTSNPSLTMAALALRSAERIHRDLLAGR